MVGADWLSTATSPHAKHVASLNSCAELQRSSPRRKIPKKAVVATAHINDLAGWDDLSSVFLICVSRWGVTGSRRTSSEELTI